mgnify:CR=1 FL=1
MVKIQVTNITKSFGQLHTLDGISLSLDENQFVSILGPSGCGKSTLFNIIAGLLNPDEGSVIIDGENYTNKTGKVSYMHQKDLLLPWKNVLENVTVPLILKGKGKEKAKKKALKYFHSFGLEGFEKSYPNQLSGGMRQRASLLRTYLFSEDIMLLDEPFGGLDAITKGKMQYWLLEVFRALKASILFITHDIDEAIFLSDKIYVLSERPASVKEKFKVNIPRPRKEDIFTNSEFIKIKKEILSLL